MLKGLIILKKNLSSTDEHDPLDDKVVEFISCWDSVPSDIKETLSAKELVDFKTFAKYVLGLRSRAPSSYSSLDAISAHNFAMNSNFLIEKCRNLGGEKVAQNDKVEDGGTSLLDRSFIFTLFHHAIAIE